MKKFKKIYIEITNVCNLSCDFCPKTKRSPEFMSRELFEEILCRIKGSTEYVYFHVLGEPLLHPEIGTFLDLCHQHGFKVNITTNGTMLDREGDLIVQKPALRQVNISVHSFNANLHSLKKDSHTLYSENPMENYIDSIFRFIDRAANKGSIFISLRLWNLKKEGNNPENRYVLRRIEEKFDLGFKIENEFGLSSRIKLAQNVFLNQAEVFSWPDVAAVTENKRGFCYGLRDQAAILVDGTVVPCCLDGEGIIKLGNIKDQNLDAIINSERAKDIYEGFSRREAVEELCRKCGYRNRFDS